MLTKDPNRLLSHLQRMTRNKYTFAWLFFDGIAIEK